MFIGTASFVVEWCDAESESLCDCDVWRERPDDVRYVRSNDITEPLSLRAARLAAFLARL